jgi:hypothetical protein
MECRKVWFTTSSRGPPFLATFQLCDASTKLPATAVSIPIMRTSAYSGPNESHSARLWRGPRKPGKCMQITQRHGTDAVPHWTWRSALRSPLGSQGGDHYGDLRSWAAFTFLTPFADCRHIDDAHLQQYVGTAQLFPSSDAEVLISQQKNAQELRQGFTACGPHILLVTPCHRVRWESEMLMLYSQM